MRIFFKIYEIVFLPHSKPSQCNVNFCFADVCNLGLRECFLNPTLKTISYFVRKFPKANPKSHGFFVLCCVFRFLPICFYCRIQSDSVISNRLRRREIYMFMFFAKFNQILFIFTIQSQ